MQTEFIYQLVAQKTLVFYIGRTSDPQRRKKEHQYSSKKAHEKKYVAIRAFEKANIKWDLEVIAEVTSPDEPYEEFYMYQALLNNAPLTNMKMGDAEMALDNPDLQNYSEFRSYVDEKNKPKPKPKKIKNMSDNDNVVFYDDLKEHLKKVSPGLQALLDKRKT